MAIRVLFTCVKHDRFCPKGTVFEVRTDDRICEQRAQLVRCLPFAAFPRCRPLVFSKFRSNETVAIADYIATETSADMILWCALLCTSLSNTRPTCGGHRNASGSS